MTRHVVGLRRRFGPSYVNTRISALRSFFRWAVTQRPPLPGIGRRDPTVDLKMRKEYPPPRAPLSAPELRALVRAAATPLERAAIMVLLDTALRRSEFLALRESDVDWHDGTILVRQGKGGRFRLVAPGRRALAALGELRNGGGPSAPLWHLSKSGIKRLLDGVGERAGLPLGTVYPHRLRVTRICDLIEGGVGELVAGTVAGHSLEMVRYYTRAIAQRRAVDTMRRHSLADRIAG